MSSAMVPSTATPTTVHHHWLIDEYPPVEFLDNVGATRQRMPPSVYHGRPLIREVYHSDPYYTDSTRRRPGVHSPYQLPRACSDLQWADLDLRHNARERDEVYTFLRAHYAEGEIQTKAPGHESPDEDTTNVRIVHTMSRAFIDWVFAGQSNPHHHPALVFGLRHKDTGELVAFVGGTIMPMRIPFDAEFQSHRPRRDTPRWVAYAVACCLHPRYRGARLTVTLGKEFLRRAQQDCNVWMGLQTAGPLPARCPVMARTNYYVRPLSPLRVQAIGMLDGLPETLANDADALHEYFAAPTRPAFQDWRVLQTTDLPALREALNVRPRAAATALSPYWVSDAHVAHWFLPRDGLLYTYVRPALGTGTPHGTPPQQEFISFYVLDKDVHHHPSIARLRVAYLHYGRCLAHLQESNTYTGAAAATDPSMTRKQRRVAQRIEEKRRKHWDAWFQDVLYVCAQQHVDMVHVQPGLVGGNVHDLTRHKCIASNAYPYVYVHNWKSPALPSIADLNLAPL